MQELQETQEMQELHVLQAKRFCKRSDPERDRVTVLSLTYTGALLVYLFLAVLVIVRNPRSALNWFCALFLFCFALWAFEDVFHHLHPLIPNKLAWLFGGIGSIGGYSFASFFLLFALALTGTRKYLRGWPGYVAIAGIPIILIVTQWSGISLFQYRPGAFGWVVAWQPTFWTVLFYAYYVSFTLFGLYLIGRFGRAATQSRQRKQAAAIFFATAVTLVLATTTDVVLPNFTSVRVPELGGAFAVIWAAGLAVSMLRYGLLAITPETAARDVLATMLDSVLLLAPDGSAVITNQATLDLLGYRKEELAGQPAVKLFDQPAEFQSAFHRVLSEQALSGIELACRARDGRVIPVAVSARVMQDRKGTMMGSVWVLRDITLQKQAQAALEASENRFKQVVENTQEWIWEVNPDGRYTYASPKVKEILGYTPEELVGNRYFFDLFLLEDQVELKTAAMKAMMSKQSFRGFINRNVHKNGRTIWLSTSGVPILDQTGNLVGYRGVDADVTEAKEAEEEIRAKSARLELLNQTLDQERTKLLQLTEQLQEANVELLRLSDVKTDFVAAVSHDLRTPLTTIIEGIALTEDGTLGPVNDEQRKFLRFAREDAERLSELISNLLDVTKIERGKMEVSRTRVNLVAAVARTIRSYETYLQEKGLTLTVENPPEAPAAWCDAGHYHRVLSNLLSNAMKFTPAGGRITIRIARDDQGAVVTSVRDTGVGIPREYHHRIFGKFEQVRRPGSELLTGTGLGLSLCRQLVELNDGKISFESAENQGSTFSFALPACPE